MKMNNHILAEFAYLTARGGILIPCDGGYRIENPIVREPGDYNAFFAHTWADIPEIKKQAQTQLTAMHYQGEYDIHILDGKVPEDIPHQTNAHWVSRKAETPSKKLKRIHPQPGAYWNWYESTVRAYTDFTEDWWQAEKISHQLFIQRFKPIWYLHGTQTIGRLYRFDTTTFVRLFSIVVAPDQRGKGHGREIITREVNRSTAPVYIRARKSLIPFYTKAGFEIQHHIAKIKATTPET